MAEQDQAERTEPATPKRREDARRKGQVAQSRELQSVAVLGCALLALGSFLGLEIVRAIGAQAHDAWSGAQLRPSTVGDFHAVFSSHVGAAGAAMLPVLLALAGAGALSQLAQTGPLFSPEILKPKASRLSPVQGFKRLVDGDRLFDLVKSLLKVAGAFGIAFVVLSASLPRAVTALATGSGEGALLAAELSGQVAVPLLMMLAAMAAVDVLYQRWRHERRLRMSRKDVRDELKDREGNPQVRGRARAMMRELSRTRMIAAVADASVVVTNPTHYAVALRYQREGMSAPEVVAKGKGEVAARIRRAAREHKVPIVENPPLARLLHRTVAVGREIPESLFQAVAEVLALVARADRARAAAWGASR